MRKINRLLLTKNNVEIDTVRNFIWQACMRPQQQEFDLLIMNPFMSYFIHIRSNLSVQIELCSCYFEQMWL